MLSNRRSGEQRARVQAAAEHLRQAIALATGSARRARQDAEYRLAALELEQLIVRQGLERADQDAEVARRSADPAFAAVRGQLEHVRHRFYGEWAQGSELLEELVATGAPGPAGSPPGDWLGQVGTDPGVIPPSLWRIGSGTVHLPAEDRRTFPAAVPLLDESHLAITSAPGARRSVDALVESLLMRVLSTIEPGAVKVHLWDIGQLTGVLPHLYTLSRAGAVTVHDPTRLDDLLDELSGHIRRSHAHAMQAGFASPRQLRRATEKRNESWRIAVLYGNGDELPPEQLRELKRVASNAVDAGICLVLVDVPTALDGSAETVRLLDERRAVTSMTGPDIAVDLDPPLQASDVVTAAARIAEAISARKGGPRTFADLLPDKPDAGHSARELRAPVGFHDGEPVEVVIGDANPHALIGGPSGSGKTNFLYALLGSLCARYSPDELALYLLDFKEGVSFAGLAPGRKDVSWLPHARLVGINVNTDREFGLALLRFLADELRRRSVAAKSHEVTNLADLRAADPDGHWPRIVAVIDEFQYMFAGRDTVTSAATALLEDIARRGRSQGIHLILASQDVAGIEAFWGKPAVFEQCTLRIAMPKARRVLAETNRAAVAAPRWHAVINHESGVAHGNQLAHVPESGVPEGFPALQRELWQRHGRPDTRPRLFDGAHSPTLDEAPAFERLRPGGAPMALLGQSIAVAEEPCGTVLSDSPGRNIAVLGTSAREAQSILDSAARSLARQHRPGEVEFLISCLVDNSRSSVARLYDTLLAAEHKVDEVAAGDLPETLAALSSRLSEPGPRQILMLYGADAALPALERKEPGKPSGLDQLRTLLKQGPANGLHVLGWWRSPARLKETLGFAGTEDIGAWAALDVQGNDLGALSAGQVVHWSPRPGRALFFDRSTHSAPEVMIPFHLPADDGDGARW